VAIEKGDLRVIKGGSWVRGRSLREVWLKKPSCFCLGERRRAGPGVLARRDVPRKNLTDWSL
jgi:hypothetical protein